MEVVAQSALKKYLIYLAFPVISLVVAIVYRGMTGDSFFNESAVRYLAAVWLIPACMSVILVGSKFRYIFMPSFWVFSLTLYLCVFSNGDYYKTTRPFFELLDSLGFPEVFLSIITINLGLILLALEAWFLWVPRWAFVFPALYFGGYFCITLISHAQYYYVMHSIYAANSRSEIAFNPDQQVLRLDLVFHDQRDVIVQYLFFHYGLSSLDFSPFDRRVFHAVLGDTQICYRVRNYEYKKFRDLRFFVRDVLFKEKKVFSHVPQGTCIILHPVVVETDVLTIKNIDYVRLPFLQLVHQNRHVISATTGQISSLFMIGNAIPFSWFPKPYVKNGCGNGGCSSYVIFEYDYSNDDTVSLTSPPNLEHAQIISEQMAMALGLVRVDPDKFQLKTIDDAYLERTVQALEAQAKKDSTAEKN